jgi:nucleolin
MSAGAPRPGEENTIFVKGFDSSLGEDAVREQLTEVFSKYGKVNQIRLPTDRESGELKGISFVEFADQAGKV